MAKAIRALVLAPALVFALLRCSSSSHNSSPSHGGQDASSESSSGGMGGVSPEDSSSDESAVDPTCDDGVKNGAEIAVDCGGGCLCATGQPCQSAADCQNSACVANKCQPPNCTDSLKNGEESDEDCGGTACPKCADLLACLVASDCTSGVCTGQICQVPNCSDLAKNADETDVDCGGVTCTDCADGLGCAGNDDCVSKLCQVQKCVPASCVDSIWNGDESDLDCGGSCGACDDGLDCNLPKDCQSQVCAQGECQVPVCNDLVANGDETDTDCGGPTCPTCADTLACVSNADCTSGVCLGNVCQAPSCSDNVKNGNESDLDCGGTLCVGCNNGDDCNGASDCKSGGCTGNVCGPWSKGFGSTGADIGYDAAVDTNGDIVIVGSFTNSVNFGGSALAGSGLACFVAKFSATGAHLWSRTFTASTAAEAKAVAIAANGDIFVTGYAGAIDFGAGLQTPNGGGSVDAFIVKLQGSDGSLVWGKLYGGSNVDQGLSVAVDGLGHVVMGGAANSATYSLGGATFTNAGFSDAFVLQVSESDGGHVWSIGTGTVGNDLVYGVATDSGSNVILTGRFNGGVADISGHVSFGITSLQSVGSGDVMIVKLDPLGNEVWAKRAGTLNDDYGFGVAVDSADSIVLAGQRSGGIDFGGGPLGTHGSIDTYIAKLSANGTHVWSLGFGGSLIDAAYDIAFDGLDPIVIGAYTSANLDLGNGVLPNNAGKVAPFLVKLSATSGSTLYSKGYLATGDSAGFVAISPARSVISIGRFASTFDMGAGSMTSAGLSDIYLASLGPVP